MGVVTKNSVALKSGQVTSFCVSTGVIRVPNIGTIPIDRSVDSNEMLKGADKHIWVFFTL